MTQSDPQQDKRFNVLLIMSDEHAAPAAGCYGHPIVQTPHLDRFAQQGVRFANAYCNGVLCVPSRASLMSGQYIHRIGAWENSSTYSSETVTLAHIMRAAGYQAHLFGSMHFIGHDQLHGFHTHLAEHLPEINRWEYERLFQTDWTGDPPYATPQVGPARPAAGKVAASSPRPYRPWLEPGEQHQFVPSDQQAHAQTLRFLDQFNPQTDAPFFAVASYRLPHFPYIAPRELYDRYADIVDEPAVGDDVPLPEALTYFEERRVRDPQRRREMRAAYYALVSQFDEFFGDLIAALDRRGLRNNTLVIYASDHGDMAGERGMFMKSVFYEWGVRVPLVMSLPGVLPQGTTLDPSVSLVDLLPTLQAMAGVEYDGPRDGRSLWQAAKGEAALDPDRPVFCDCYGYGIPGPGRMTRMGDWKLILYPDYGTPELYHLGDDPNETTNRFDDPAAADARDRLLSAATADWDAAALREQVIANQKQRRLMVQAHRCFNDINVTHLPQ